jgi:hypothetical protein
MAGTFGALAEKCDLSIQVVQDLIDKIENQARGTEIIASGTSCRHQISDLTNARSKHIAEPARRGFGITGAAANRKRRFRY